MTPDEQDAMTRHAAYWRELMGAGRVVVYGPVADPEGVWGLGVVRAGSQAEVVELGEEDPVIVAGIATFDVAEIMGGITGGPVCASVTGSAAGPASRWWRVRCSTRRTARCCPTITGSPRSSGE